MAVASETLSQYRTDISTLYSVSQDMSQCSLIQQHLPLVLKIARRYEHYDVELLDLVQEGNIGLIHAARKFDPSFNVPFAAYAPHWIKQAILRALPERFLKFHVPFYKIELFYRLNREQGRLQAQLGQEPTREQLAEVLEISVDLVEDLQTLPQSVISIDAPTTEDEGTSLGDVLEANPAQNPEECLLQQELAQILLSPLSLEEKQVVMLRYGLKDGKEYSHNAIANILKKDRNTIIRLEQRAFLKMRRIAILQTMRNFLE